MSPLPTRPAWAVTLALILLCGGCRASYKELRKKHEAAIEAKLGQLEKIGKLLDVTAPISVDDERIVLPPSTTVPPAGLFGNLNLAVHVSLMYQEAFADLTAHGPSAKRISGSNQLNVCASLLRKSQCPSDCGYLECTCGYALLPDLFERCAAIQYVLVVRTLEYGAPAQATRTTPDLAVQPRGPDRGAAAAERSSDAGAARDRGPDRPRRDARVESWTFHGGLLRAEVHVYELATARRLGGFRVRAESDPRLTRSTFVNEAMPAYQVQSALDQDFTTRCQSAILEGIRRHVPGALK
jgi:hypothetical protein